MGRRAADVAAARVEVEGQEQATLLILQDQRDVVRSLGRRGRLTFERGSYCGFEGDWEGTREVVVIPSGDDARA